MNEDNKNDSNVVTKTKVVATLATNTVTPRAEEKKEVKEENTNNETVATNNNNNNNNNSASNTKIVAPNPIPKQTNSDLMGWLSATGSKYHAINNCGKMNANNATQVTLEQAKNSYGSCSKCNPPQ